jgi:transposase-like protein
MISEALDQIIGPDDGGRAGERRHENPIERIRQLEARALRKAGEETKKVLPHRRQDISDEMVRSALAEGKSYAAIAREFDTTSQTIYRRVRSMKAAGPSSGVASEKPQTALDNAGDEAQERPAAKVAVNGSLDIKELTALVDACWNRLSPLDKLRLLLK